MYMLRRIDPGLKSPLQPVIAGIAEPEGVPEDDWNGIPGIQESADKLRSGEGRGQKTSDAFLASGKKRKGNTAENRGSGDAKYAQTGLPGFFSDQKYEKNGQQEEENDPTPGKHDSEGEKTQPGEYSKTERRTEKNQHESEEQIDRISVRVLEKTRLASGNQKPGLKKGNMAQEEGENHHGGGGIGHFPQQIHALIRSILLQE